MKRVLIVAGLALAASGVLATSAQANVGTATISCTQTTFSYQSFRSGANTVQETVSVDGAVVASKSFTFPGPSGTDAVNVTVPAGTHTVVARAQWNTNGQTGSFQVTKTLTCGPPTCPRASIKSNFNGTAIAAGNKIWFNSVLKAKGAENGGTIDFRNQTITFSANGTPFSVSVPNGRIVFSTSATTATTTFSGGQWTTTVPAGFGDDVFLSGVAFTVPAGGLPGGINPVTWQGDFTTSNGVSLNWKWGAAVYTTFGSNGALGVKPTHSTSLDQYHNGDQAGTPENFKQFVIGGARGGGGANATGSYSATGSCP
jgi:hypothetical protein